MTTKVWETDKDDWHKLIQVLQYLRGTIYMPLILRNDSLNVIKWLMDAWYEVHVERRCHTDSTMSLICR